MTKQDVAEALQRLTIGRSRPIRRVGLKVADLLSRPTTLPQEENFEWWLRNSIPGWLAEGHPFLMDRAFRELPTEDPILEIGTFCGLSTNVMRYLLDQRGL